MNYAIDDLIDHARTVFENAKSHPLASTKMAEFGYHKQKIEEGKALLEAMLSLQMEQEDCYSNEKGLKQQLDRDLEAVKALYKEHLGIARFTFRNDAAMQARLELHRPRKRSQAKATHQIRKFYIRVEEVMPQMKKYGAKVEEFAQAKAMIDAISAARAKRKQCQGNAQSATQQRNKAKKELQAWLADFKKIARVALKDEQQLLEVFGMVVRSS